MAALQEGNPLGDAESVYRRIPAAAEYYNPSSEPTVQWIAFKPSRNDSNGLSVWRASDVNPEGVVQHGRPGKSYYLVKISVGDLRRLGADVIPTPAEGMGHVSIPALSWVRYNSAEKQKVMELAKEIVLTLCPSENVTGPYRTPEMPKSTE